MLRRRGYYAAASGPGVEVRKRSSNVCDIVDVVIDIAIDEVPPLDLLLADVSNLQREKWDWALPDQLLRKAYESLYLNIDEAHAWTKTFRSRELVQVGVGEA